MDPSLYAKRPKRGEGDEDLLKFQEDFLRGRSIGVPAAKVIRVGQTPDASRENDPAKLHHDQKPTDHTKMDKADPADGRPN